MGGWGRVSAVRSPRRRWQMGTCHRTRRLRGSTHQERDSDVTLSFGFDCYRLMLAGCGSSTTDRALSGGGIGAAAGAGTAAVTGGSPVTGGLLGGAAGAAIGGLTDEDDVNLGDPIWNRDNDDDND